ncbi:MAG: TraB/GumN family protein, partial [Alphaproteobacteria bacterium]|nr:TraB/GumN family protein [Alphaproteobacteria bacterium]
TLLIRAAEKSDDAVKEVGALTAAWARGDVAALEKVINDDVDAVPAARRAIITDRNRRWSAWVHKRLERPGTVLMAVGAGHLVGPDGVPAMLEAEGMTVRRVQ